MHRGRRRRRLSPFRVVQDYEFNYHFYHPSFIEGEFCFRDLTPKDLYFLSYLSEELEVPDIEKSLRLICRLFLGQDSYIYNMGIKDFSSLSQSVSKNILDKKVMEPTQWLELAFHLCKQRWGESIDWLERQPMTKVMAMMDIQVSYGKKIKENDKSKNKK